MPGSTTVATAERWLFSTIFSSPTGGTRTRIGVAALDRGTELEAHLLRAFGIVQRQFGLADLPAVFVEKDLDHAAGQPDGVDRAGHPGHVVQHHAVGTVDAGHLDVAVGEVAAQAGAHAHAVHDQAQFAGRPPADCRPSCGCRRKAGSPRRLRRGRIASRRPTAPGPARCLAVGVRAGRSCGPSSSLGLLGKGDRQQAEIVLELLAPFFQLARGPD